MVVRDFAFDVSGRTERAQNYLERLLERKAYKRNGITT